MPEHRSKSTLTSADWLFLEAGWREALYEQESLMSTREDIDMGLPEREPLTLDSILDFGKHATEQVEDLIYDQPGYIRWMVNNNVREFDQVAMNLIEAQIDLEQW